MPPKVQTLDELYALNNPIFDPQRAAVRDQMTAATQSGQAEEQGLIARKDQAFKDISQLASNRKMLFSGFTPDQQAKYTGTQFMPAMAGLRGKVQDNIARLQSALLGLDTDQRKTAMGTKEKQEGMLYNYNQEQDRRKFEKEQSETAYQREMEKLRQTQSFQRSQNESSGKAGTDVLGYFKQRLAEAGPLNAGNAKAARQQQDQWVYQWFLDNGVLDPGAQTQVWNLINSAFNRSEDPTKDWLYKR